MSTQPDRPTVVLVHGALTDASVWHPVIADLQHRGHAVLAPAMPMRSLAADADYLHSVLATVPGPIVLAGHSYGGSIISHPAAITPAVGGLAFLAAFQQDAGETAGELNYRFPGSRLPPTPRRCAPTTAAAICTCVPRTSRRCTPATCPASAWR